MSWGAYQILPGIIAVKGHQNNVMRAPQILPGIIAVLLKESPREINPERGWPQT